MFRREVQRGAQHHLSEAFNGWCINDVFESLRGKAASSEDASAPRRWCHVNMYDDTCARAREMAPPNSHA